MDDLDFDFGFTAVDETELKAVKQAKDTVEKLDTGLNLSLIHI